MKRAALGLLLSSTAFSLLWLISDMQPEEKKATSPPQWTLIKAEDLVAPTPSCAEAGLCESTSCTAEPGGCSGCCAPNPCRCAENPAAHR